MKYVSPTLVECGNSMEVIKGECGWGTENATLDKTGAKKAYRNRTYRVVTGQGPGAGYNACRRELVCETDSDQC
ncbi:hypothetical protein PQ460_20360 [Paenibacillus sp. KACC 21273]|uniref:hypothetical protein n=1 Tax=Paenibacillus sp. KACC 21273 TaxID=3025665 RepID=UPI002365C2A4|nr:hypothetical protein [Paenibacillus sp. KACC 21273]WDF50311.1 hypothetical protein PQ460_20360 [Paenibacillus sp. KACC 21273]